MTLFLLSVFLGIVPMVAYAVLIWRIDRWEKEPFPLLLAAFLWGAVPSIVFAIVAQGVLAAPLEGVAPPESLFARLYQASFAAPVSEEIVKMLGLLLLFRVFAREIDSVLDGLIYGSMIGFGFSAVENVFYFVAQPDASSLVALFFLRAFVFGMLHALFTGLAGVGFALGKFSRRPSLRILWPLLGLALAILTHSLHNAFATLGGRHILYALLGLALGLAWFVVTVAICLHHENRWIRIHLADEVSRGVLFAEQADEVSHFWHRFTVLALLFDGPVALRRRRLLHEATELAYEKQRQSRPGEDENPVRIEKLRAIVAELSRRDPFVLSGRIVSQTPEPPPLPPVRRV